MKRDPRTPRTYFKKGPDAPTTPTSLKNELADLLDVLIALRDDPDASPTAKNIAVDDLDRFDRKQYRYFSQQNATKILDAVAEGDTEGAVEALKTALLFKVHHRVKPQMVKTGEEVEEELFWLNQYGHK